MFIGSDKNELFEFLGRKREHYQMNIRNFIKVAVGLTVLHILLFRIPKGFEIFFGDETKASPAVKVAKQEVTEDDLKNSKDKTS